MISPVQRWAAVLLAATYLVVGATGESLYYLVESPRVAQTADDHTSDGHFHHHGDGLWHHHGGHLLERATAEQAGCGGSLVDLDASDRHDHTTLFLAIASAIELSLLAPLPLAEAARADLLLGLGESGLAPTSARATLGPRGPPANGFA